MTTLVSTGLKFQDGEIFLLDQQALPHQEKWIDATSPENMMAAIKALKVRGAPLIGVSAALCLGLFALKAPKEEILVTAQRMRETRPTAVNLMWAIDRLLKKIDRPTEMWTEALNIFHEDVSLCKAMGIQGAPYIQNNDNILTHCNTGGLATAGIGTALGVIRTAWAEGKKIHVYVDETRPLLQGGRLTTWELEQLGIPYTLIADNMAAMLMAQGKIQKVFLGADRVAMNGDFANKIGTYSVAVNAFYHQIPFYPVAPYSTWDPDCPDGSKIPIEERQAHEIQGVSGSFGTTLWAPKKAQTYNPAFDVTPVRLVTALITDQGVYSSMELQAGKLKELV